MRWWQDPAVDLAEVPYVFLWNPTPGWLATLPNLRLILSSGAGVDHITSDPAWPRHVPIVRMGGPETAQRMGEYVCLAALALLRDLPAAIAGQAARRLGRTRGIILAGVGATVLAFALLAAMAGRAPGERRNRRTGGAAGWGRGRGARAGPGGLGRPRRGLRR